MKVAEIDFVEIDLQSESKLSKEYGIEFDAKSRGRHSGKFVRGNLSFPVKAHGKKMMLLPYASTGLIKKFDLPSDVFDKQ